MFTSLSWSWRLIGISRVILTWDLFYVATFRLWLKLESWKNTTGKISKQAHSMAGSWCGCWVGADLRPLHLIWAPHSMVAELQERMFQQTPVEATWHFVSQHCKTKNIITLLCFIEQTLKSAPSQEDRKLDSTFQQNQYKNNYFWLCLAHHKIENIIGHKIP